MTVVHVVDVRSVGCPRRAAHNLRRMAQALRAPEPVLLLVHASWCPHCVRMMPHWESVVAWLSAREPGAPRVHAVAIESEMLDAARPHLARAGVGEGAVQGFPTILLLGARDRLGVDDYDGERTAAALKRFLQQRCPAGPVEAGPPSAGALLPGFAGGAARWNEVSCPASASVHLGELARKLAGTLLREDVLVLIHDRLAACPRSRAAARAVKSWCAHGGSAAGGPPPYVLIVDARFFNRQTFARLGLDPPLPLQLPAVVAVRRDRTLRSTPRDALVAGGPGSFRAARRYLR